MTNGTYVMRQEFSSARSAQIQYRIDWPEKIVEVSMASAGGQEFLNPDVLVDLVKTVLPQRYGVIAYDKDSEDSHHPVATDWRIVVTLAGLRLSVRLIQPVFGGFVTEISALANGLVGKNG